MASKIILNGRVIDLYSYKEEIVNELYTVSVDFNVTSDDYHDMATLLYSESFDVKIPERDITFKGIIHNYSTSITNLYVKGQIGQYTLTLMEVSHKEKD